MTPTLSDIDLQPEDPLVTKYVEAAIEPYRGSMPLDDLEVIRLRLVVFYETNPVAVALLDEIRQEQQKAPVVARSSEQSRLDEAALLEASRRSTGGAKGGGR